jgi:hypothetical protein
MYQQVLMQQKEQELQKLQKLNQMKLLQQQKSQHPQYPQHPQLGQQQQQQHQRPRFINTNQQDIDRTRMLYQQKYINNNYQPTDLNLDYDNTDSDNTDSDEDNQSENIKQQIIYEETPHFIAISTLDRDWMSNDPNTSQYNFQLKFSPSGDSINVVPLYQNNPTVPATKEEALNGTRGQSNTNGWTDENGVEYPPYNPSEPFGEIIQYEKIVELGQKGLGLYNSFKNIVSIELVSAIMPSMQRFVDYSTSLKESCVDENYYIMEVEEINDVMDGTSKDLKNCFSILTPVIRIYDISAKSAKSIEYKSTGLWYKRFTPTPLSSLTNLSIKLKKPSGDLIKNLNDTLDIKFIYQEQSDLNDPSTDILVIQTTKYFSSDEYKPSDTLIIKNYKHYSTNTQNNSSVSYFNDWMNRKSGHKILSVSTSEPNKFLRNRICISKPAYLDINNGNITEENWYNNFKTTVLDTVDTINDITTFDTGRFINIDIQNLYLFKITTKEHKVLMNTERV